MLTSRQQQVFDKVTEFMTANPGVSAAKAAEAVGESAKNFYTVKKYMKAGGRPGRGAGKVEAVPEAPACEVVQLPTRAERRANRKAAGEA